MPKTYKKAEKSEKSQNKQAKIEKSEKRFRDKVALIISLLFIAILGLVSYRYFNNQTYLNLDRFKVDLNLSDRFNYLRKTPLPPREAKEDEENILATNTTSEEKNNITQEEQNTTSNNTNIENASNKDQNTNTPASKNESSSVFAQLDSWRATDYKKGDIKPGKHTVKPGDTLWEISEAVYGNGNMWTNILNANSNDIGYLPDGTQALILPGQTLNIPPLN